MPESGQQQNVQPAELSGPLAGYVAISITDIKSDDIVPFDIYLYLERNQKLILYKKKDQMFDDSKLKYFQTMKVKFFYIRQEDQDSYQKYVSQALVNILDNDKFTEEEKQVQIKKATKEFLDDIFIKESDHHEQLEQNASAIVKNIVASVSKDIKIAEIYDRLASMISDEGTTFSHSLNVSTYSVLFSFLLGVVRTQEISNLGLAAILHDIALAALPKDIVDKYRNGEVLNTSEMLKIRGHPNAAESIIKKRYRDFSGQVIWIIRQHHEQPDGKGYPLGLKGENIAYLAKILAIANHFDNTARITKLKGLTPSPSEIFAQMKRDWGITNQIFDKEMFDQLIAEIGVNLG